MLFIYICIKQQLRRKKKIQLVVEMHAAAVPQDFYNNKIIS